MDSDEPPRLLALGVAMEGWLAFDPPHKRNKRLRGVIAACDRYLSADFVESLTDRERSEITNLRALAERLIDHTRDS